MLNKKVIIIATAALKYDEARVFSEKAAAASPSSSLLRFAHKTPKNRLSADFLPYKLRKQPDNRGFFAASSAKIHKCNRLLEVLLKTSPDYRGKAEAEHREGYE